MAQQAREAMGTTSLTALADRGYFSGPQIRACEQQGIIAWVPKTLTSNNRAKRLFDKSDFEYLPKQNAYRCPAGQRAIFRHTTVDYRRIGRWEHEAVVDTMQRRLDRTPRAAKIRRQTIEQTYGTIKSWMGSTHFLTRTLPRVSLQMFGTRPLMQMIRT